MKTSLGSGASYALPERCWFRQSRLLEAHRGHIRLSDGWQRGSCDVSLSSADGLEAMAPLDGWRRQGLQIRRRKGVCMSRNVAWRRVLGFGGGSTRGREWQAAARRGAR